MTRHVTDPTGAITGVETVISIEDVVQHVEETPYQHVLIVETKAFGKALFLDQVINSAAVDEGLYHSALVHPAMFLHMRPERVLIGGGAEGATLREVLKHTDVQQVAMVDIDERVVAACKRHLPEWHQGAFDDPRATILHHDIRQALEFGTGHTFDVIVLDLGDPASCPESQRGYTQEFFWLVRRHLADGGVFAMQAGEFMGKEGDNFHTLYETVRSVFPHTLPYRVGISSFMSTWGFIIASGQPLRLREDGKLPVGIEHRIRESKSDFPWFDAQGFTAMTWLPPQLRAMYEKKRPDLINKDDARTLQHVEAPESLLESHA